MRRLPIALLAALLSSGCFVLDEIDSGQQVMDQHYGKARRDKESAEAAKAGKTPPGAPAAAAQKEEGVLARVRGWWDAKSAQGGGGAPGAAPDSGPPPHPDDVLVRCKVGSTTQYMRKFDCQLRGGKAADV
jgi:hypothetical protein